VCVFLCACVCSLFSGFDTTQSRGVLSLPGSTITTYSSKGDSINSFIYLLCGVLWFGKKKKKMGGSNSKGLSYYAPDGNLIVLKHNSKHDGKKEYTFVSAHDGYLNAGDECYLIHAQWIESWTSFVQAVAKAPGPITNHLLCDITPLHPGKKDDKNAEVVAFIKRGLLPKTDFRPIKKIVWEYFFKLYGGGPVMVLFVPNDMTPKQYQNGSWVKHCDIASLTTVVRTTTSVVSTRFNCLLECLLSTGDSMHQAKGI
jgi:hypothetical protein